MPSSGRPKGSRTVRSAKTVEHLVTDGGKLPLDVMMQTMRELWAEAEAVKEADKGRSLHLKTIACGVAERCAPYIHPRLSSTNVNIRNIQDVTDLSDAEIAALIASGRVGAPAAGAEKSDSVH